MCGNDLLTLVSVAVGLGADLKSHLSHTHFSSLLTGSSCTVQEMLSWLWSQQVEEVLLVQLLERENSCSICLGRQKKRKSNLWVLTKKSPFKLVLVPSNKHNSITRSCKCFSAN